MTFNLLLLLTASAHKYLQYDWSRRVQYISYCSLNISFLELPKNVKAKQLENIWKKIKMFLK